jgi:glycosyltransferase involved in cell wall biosynthesis
MMIGAQPRTDQYQKKRVSVVIPTRNSSATIEQCLESIKHQSYDNLEVIVVDTNSSDNTKAICSKYGTKFVNTEWRLLGARFVGFENSRGDYFLMLDSDQILEKAAIQQCVDAMSEYDQVCLGERTYNPETFLQKMFEADRRLIHEQSDLQLDPGYGTLVPRFYKRFVLQGAFSNIPKQILPFVVAHEDSILYYEAIRVSDKVGVVPDALFHKEPSSVLELWKKNRKYGRAARELVDAGFYSSLVTKKRRFRRSRGISRNRILSTILLALKGPAYLIGFYFR